MGSFSFLQSGQKKETSAKDLLFLCKREKGLWNAALLQFLGGLPEFPRKTAGSGGAKNGNFRILEIYLIL